MILGLVTKAVFITWNVPLHAGNQPDVIFSKLIRDFVGLYAVMKRTNAVTKLLGHIENGEHLIGAVTVHVNENVAAQCAGQRVEFEVAPRWRVGE